MTSVTVALCTACIAVQTLAAQPTHKAKEWRDDLHFFVHELEARHANLYNAVSPSSFAAAARRLEQRIPTLTDDRIVVELARLGALVGDGHTGVFLPFDRRNGFARYPIELWLASDGVFVLATTPESSSLAGAEVTHIGDTPIQTVLDSLRNISPADGPGGIPEMVALTVPIANVLHAFGFARSASEVDLRIRDSTGVARIVHLTATPPLPAPVLQPADPKAMWIARRREKYWSTVLPERTVYVQYNSADISRGAPDSAFARFCDDVLARIDSVAADRLIVDLRWNTGGRGDVSDHLLQTIVRARRIFERGKLFVIVGRNTFSAGSNFTFALESHTPAIFVGEPTAGRPNTFGELGRFRLPHSGLEVRYSGYEIRMSDPGDHRTSLVPSLIAVPTIADFRQGRDVALDAIRRYHEPAPLTTAVLGAAPQPQGEALIARIAELQRCCANDYRTSPSGIVAVGDSLAALGRLSDAVSVLRYAVTSDPRWGYARFRLGESLALAGHNAEAIAQLDSAFMLDKALSRARDHLLQLRALPK